MPPTCADLNLRDYSPPFWAAPKAGGKKTAEELRETSQPPTWISVLGRDGFWPIAALTDTNNPEWQANPLAELGKTQSQTSWQEWSQWSLRQIVKAGESLISLGRVIVLSVFFWKESSAPYPGGGAWPEMPLAMKLCLVCILAWAAFHLYCCARPSLTVKPGHRAHFVRMNDRSHLALIVFGSVIVAFVPILLGWGFGAMSAAGEPVPHGWAYRVFLPAVWILVAAAICSNAWVESPRYPRTSRLRIWRPSLRRLRRRGAQICFVSRRPLAYYAAASALLYCIVDFSLNETLSDANRVPTFWRAIHLTTGVSPLVPLLSLAAGLYLWFWYSLQGLALFGAGRPELPSQASLQVDAGDGTKLSPLCMFSQELMLAPIEKLACPFSREIVTTAVVLAPLLFAVSWLMEGGVRCAVSGRAITRSFSVLEWISASASCSPTPGNCCGCGCVCGSFCSSWIALRCAAPSSLSKDIPGVRYGRWAAMCSMSATSCSRVNWRACTTSSTPRERCRPPRLPKHQAPVKEQLSKADQALHVFAGWYSRHWDDWRTRDLAALTEYQQRIATVVGTLLSQSLVFEWRAEKKSIIAESAHKEASDEADKSDSGADEVAAILEKLVESAARLQARAALPALAVAGPLKERAPEPEAPDGGHSAYIANAEELVCLVYLGFIQNVLGRLRTLVLGIVWLFVAASFSVATYPFDPRPSLSAAMLLLFLLIGVAIVIVYSQMHRDATLSHVTNTEPGELGSQFWLKLLGFGAGPLLGLLATVFPELTSTLFSWLQPGLASIK